MVKNKIASSKSLPGKVLFVVNVIFALLMLICYTSSYINPSNFWLIGVIALGYPLLLLGNLFFVVFWLVFKSRRSLVSILVLLVGMPTLFKSFNMGPDKEASSFKSKPIKVMSYNVRLFDLYNWSKNSETRSKMFDFIKKEKPDIFCIQEFYTHDSTSYDNTRDLSKLLGTSYFHTVYTETLRRSEHWGMALFSKYPILKKGRVYFNEKTSNSAMYCDILVGADTLRCYNIHMESVRFQQEDYAFFKNIRDNKEERKIEGTRKVLKRLKTAFLKRGKQVDELNDHINNSPYQVVICGDFNDTPSSYTYRKIIGDRKDAFLESGYGLGITYNGVLPALRIDYIIHGKRMNSLDFTVHKLDYSDHYPLSCKVYLREQKH